MGIANYTLNIVKPFIQWMDALQQQTATSSGWFVANSNTKATDTDIDDPQQSAEDGTKAFIIDVKGKSFVDLYHFYVGTDPAADVKVRAFGFWEVETAGKGGQEPKQISTSYPAVSDAHVGGGFWGPLYDPIAGGTHEQTLHAAAAVPTVTNDGSSITYKVGSRITYGTDGASLVLIHVSQASASPTVGMVLAHVGN